MKPTHIISLEMNELNFEFVNHYVGVGELPAFAALFKQNGFVQTRAENSYPALEPWIQWPTVYTGKVYAEHGIFRLGDAVQKDIPQIWEQLEQRKVSVGAVSPMNARNDCRAPAFFLPDPWTETPITASPRIEKLFKAIRNIVNANSHGKFKMGDLWTLASLGVWKVRAGSLPTYLSIVKVARKEKWARALLLDRLLTDMFIRLWASSKPGYCSLFLNAVAHVQHHHLFDSAVYSGDHRNPVGYGRSGTSDIDPLLFAYRIYDKILADIMAIPGARVMVTTALSQMPNQKPFYQYRFVDHDAMLTRLGIAFERATPRMSRDFSLFFASEADKDTALARFADLSVAGKPLITAEVRPRELFCQIAYQGTPEALAEVIVDGKPVDMREDIALVSIENAVHQTIGFHADTAMVRNERPVETIPLNEIYNKTIAAFA